jgi:hypothetical protein
MKKLSFSLAIFLLLFTNIVFAQQEKLVGTWQLMMPSAPNGLITCYTTLRTFDEKGNCTQIVITQDRTFIEEKATWEFVDGKAKQAINSTIFPDRVSKVYIFNYSFVKEGDHQLLINEGQKKDWREVWKKVEVYKP